MNDHTSNGLALVYREQAWNSGIFEAAPQPAAWHLWHYRSPAVVLGCSQRPDAGQEGRAARLGLPLLQRRSGGGAVLEGPWMLGLSVFLPTDHPHHLPSLARSYRWLAQLIERSLEIHNVEAYALPPELVPKKQPDDPLSWACFANFSAWELADAQGRKLVGLAQIRKRSGLLLVAGILLDRSPWQHLVEVMGQPSEQAAMLEERTAHCGGLAGDQLALTLGLALYEELGVPASQD
jgi:lipoate-protein ligase A